jgi:hypothetical protein
LSRSMFVPRMTRQEHQRAGTATREAMGASHGRDLRGRAGALAGGINLRALWKCSGGRRGGEVHMTERPGKLVDVLLQWLTVEPEDG